MRDISDEGPASNSGVRERLEKQQCVVTRLSESSTCPLPKFMEGCKHAAKSTDHPSMFEKRLRIVIRSRKSGQKCCFLEKEATLKLL